MNESRRWKSTLITKALATVNAIFREIFDESAYARFLARQGIASSKSAYAGFLHEQETQKSRCPKCC